jgi:hypothetical protein
MILYEDQGKVKSQAKKKLSDLAHVFADFSNGDEHDPIPIGGFEVELDAEVSEKDFLSGAAFLSSSSAAVSSKPPLSFANKGFVNPMGGVKKGFVPPMMRGAAVGGLQSLENSQKRVRRFTPAYDPNGDSALVLNRDAWYASNAHLLSVPDDLAPSGSLCRPRLLAYSSGRLTRKGSARWFWIHLCTIR